MRERSEQVLRIACLVLAGLLVLQVAFRVLRRDPLAKVVIPPLPALTNSAEPELKATHTSPHVARIPGTNAVPSKSATNQVGVSTVSTNTPGTNASVATSGPAASPNPRAQVASGISETPKTPASSPVKTNVVASIPATNHSATGTDAVVVGKLATNRMAATGPIHPPTNSVARAHPSSSGMPGGPGPGARPRELPASIQARVDRIIESELLGPVMHPLPMALLGIAGDVAFLRGPNGQTGLVKAGDKLGELKLVQIGVNRVLVEEDGQKKELTIFNGYGSESLITKTQENSQ